MPRSRPGFLIMDASVLIDFCEADRTVLALVSKHVGQIYVPLPILREEVDQLSEEDWPALGITPVEPPFETAALAAQRRPGLSFYDTLCLLLARDNRWTCVTNDGRLRRECAREGIPTLWGLETLALVVEVRALPTADGAKLGHAMHRANPLYITERILEGFLRRIGLGTTKASRPRRR